MLSRRLLAIFIVLIPTIVLCVSAFSGRSGQTPKIGIPPGIPTKEALDYLEQKANELVQQAASSASLVTDKAARDAQLLIQAAKQALGDEMDKQWDRIDEQKHSLLLEIDRTLQTLDKEVTKIGEIKDGTILDINAVVDRFPFMKPTPKIQRVEGASQFYLDGKGGYRITLSTNLVELHQSPLLVFLDKAEKSLPSDYVVLPGSAHQLVLNLTNEDLGNKFTDFDMAQVKIRLKTDIPNRAFWSRWKHPTIPAELTVTLELFPKFPVQYSLIEKDKEDQIDTTKVKVQPGSKALIPGCGDDGCNAYRKVCTDLLIEPGIQQLLR